MALFASRGDRPVSTVIRRAVGGVLVSDDKYESYRMVHRKHEYTSTLKACSLLPSGALGRLADISQSGINLLQYDSSLQGQLSWTYNRNVDCKRMVTMGFGLQPTIAVMGDERKGKGYIAVPACKGSLAEAKGACNQTNLCTKCQLEKETSPNAEI
eukprot:1156056-Pelagomonas_calceolata.AAC.1